MFAGIVSNKASLVSGIFILILAAIAIVTKLAPGILPYDPYAQNLGESLLGPSAQHWFGTDIQGRDIFCRVLVGTQITLTVGLAAVAISLTVGVILGSIAGYKGGKCGHRHHAHHGHDAGHPLHPSGHRHHGGARARHREGGRGHRPGGHSRVRAHRALGDTLHQGERLRGRRARHRRFQLHDRVPHVLPNVLPSIIVRATLGISTAILDAAALGFLGLGVQPPAAEWGDMLGRGRNELFRAPWLMIFPGLAITLTVLAFNLLGDGVRDGLDPKARKR